MVLIQAIIQGGKQQYMDELGLEENQIVTRILVIPSLEVGSGCLDKLRSKAIEALR